MQAILGSVMAVSSFGAAYAAHMIFPVKPIDEADVLLAQTTVGTVNVLNRETLELRSRTPRELIELYLQRKANLEDVIEIITGKNTIPEAYAALQRMPPSPEILFLIRATENNYGALLNPAPSAPPARPSDRAAAAVAAAEANVAAIRRPQPSRPSDRAAAAVAAAEANVAAIRPPPPAPVVPVTSYTPPATQPRSLSDAVTDFLRGPDENRPWPPPDWRVPTLEEMERDRVNR